MQLRLETELGCEEYVSRKAWRDASILHCPFHPKGGCGFRRCGSYGRVNPAGVRIARYWCPKKHITFSLVPDFVATRVSSSLVDIEEAVTLFDSERAESADVERAARIVRPDIEASGALKWVNRRRRWVKTILATVIGLLPELLEGCEPTLASARNALGCKFVLVRLREIAPTHLPNLPAPLGFGPLPKQKSSRSKRMQHKTGADPP